MFGHFLRTNKIAAGILLFLRIYLGWKWITSGWPKVTGGFDASGYLGGAAANPVVNNAGELIYPNYVAFLESFAIPNAGLFSMMVAWGEVLVGLGLIFGVLTTAAAFFGVVMNFSFMFAGTISTNPWMVLFSMFILAAGANAGRYGGDRWILPYFKSKIFKNKEGELL